MSPEQQRDVVSCGLRFCIGAGCLLTFLNGAFKHSHLKILQPETAFRFHSVRPDFSIY